MVNKRALKTHVMEIGRDHARVGDGFDRIVVACRAIHEVVVKTDAIEFERGAANEVNAALQNHVVFESALSGTAPGRMRVFGTGTQNVEMRGFRFAVFAGGDVLGKKDANARIGRGLTRQKDFEGGKGVLLRDLDMNSGGGVG